MATYNSQAKNPQAQKSQTQTPQPFASTPLVDAAKPFHLPPEATFDTIGKYVILVGDPGRCAAVATNLEDAVKLGVKREFEIWTGTRGGQKISVCSTGIGGPSTAIAVEELVGLGAHTFIRVGTCGGIDLDVRAGDAVIATGAIRAEGTTLEYSRLEFPAVPDFTVTRALADSAESLHRTTKAVIGTLDFSSADAKFLEAAAALAFNYHLGVVQCKDSFYGQHSPGASPVATDLLTKWENWKRMGAKASEMESAALFIVGAARRVRTGAIFHVIWNQEREAAGLHGPENHDVDRVIKIAVDALDRLIAADHA